MADFTIKRNDTAPPLGLMTLRDSTGTAVNLTGATAITLTLRTTGGSIKFTSACTVVNATLGQIQYQWTATDTDTAGTFDFQVQVIYANGKKQTFPTLGSMSLLVDPDLDAA